jgi:hypothetical protein
MAELVQYECSRCGSRLQVLGQAQVWCRCGSPMQPVARDLKPMGTAHRRYFDRTMTEPDTTRQG